MKQVLLPFFGCFLIASAMGQTFQNIQIDGGSGGGYQPCEPSIAIGIKDPSVMVAGSILNNVYLSEDSGRTWQKDHLESRYGVYGDPCIVASPKGGFYYLHLSDPDGKGWASIKLLDRIVCQYSKDGETWSKGGGIGLNGSKDQDKEWAITSLDGEKVYSTWTQFDKYNSKEAGDSTLILFSCSKHGGAEWSEPQRISAIAGDCLDDDETVEGAVPAVGPNDEIYVSWALNDKIYFDRSFDQGKTWLEKDLVAANISGGWAHDIPGIMRANGMPVTVCDQSEGEHRGRIYINWADQSNGVNDTDVWLVYSDDHGNTWSDPIRVNQDQTNSQQFFTWMDIDQSTGMIAVVYYDRSNYDDFQTDVVLATSWDSGETWNSEVISEQPFVPTSQVFFGDYNNISVHEGLIRPIWTRCDNGKLSVWTALINAADMRP